MITLYQPKAMFGLPSASPFCLKLEAFLRWQKIPFSISNALPFEGPFKKVPFVEYNGQKLGDSTHIIERLLRDKNIRCADTADVAVGQAFQRLTEEHLYWTLVYFRWQDDTAWPTLRDAFFGGIPWLVRPFIVASARRQARRALLSQGIGRLTPVMILNRARADLNALSLRLQHHNFICGDHLTHYDLAIWAVLKQLIDCELKTQLTDIAVSFTSLSQYVERINSLLAAHWQLEPQT